MSRDPSQASLPILKHSSSIGNLKRKVGISKKIVQRISADPPDDCAKKSEPNVIVPDQTEDNPSTSAMRRRSISMSTLPRVLSPSMGNSDDYEFSSGTPSTSRHADSLDDGSLNGTVQTQSILLPRISSQEARKSMEKSYLYVKNRRKSIAGIQDRDELERCFPDGKVTIFVGTWNMAGQDIPLKALTDWLIPDSMHTTADIYAVGIQEAVFNPNGFKLWESKLQHCLWSCKQVLFHSVSLGVQHLAIFVRRELIWYLSRVSHCSRSTRIVSNVKTKGAIAIGFKLFGTTLLFISCHLSYGPDADTRIKDYYRIVESLHLKRFTWRGSNALDNVDAVFWAGDLNFRLEEKRSAIEKMINAANKSVPIDFSALLEKDQLQRGLASGKLFEKFHESIIRFPPTYKYDLGTSRLDTSAKNRVPAYTDRILYRTKSEDEQDKLESLLYDSVESVKNSDHKPVYGVFRLKLKAGKDRMLTPKFDAAIFQASLNHDHDDAPKYGAAMKSKMCSMM